METAYFGFWFFWYKTVPREIVFYFKILYLKLLDSFSIPIIIRTFFAPWKRDEVFVKNAPLNVRIYVWVGNLISRLIGAFLRSAVFLGFVAVMVLWVVALISVLCFWLFYPLIVLFLGVAALFYLAKGLYVA